MGDYLCQNYTRMITMMAKFIAKTSVKVFVKIPKIPIFPNFNESVV